jgi:hypothetical protein
MAAIFVSYRRADAGWAGRLANALQEQYDIFFDTDSIETGDRFPDSIRDALEGFQIFLVAIGPEWMKKNNLKRLSNPDDWVRKEIMRGLEKSHEHNVHILPVLLGGASFPEADDLPDVLRPLASINVTRLSHESWSRDLTQLTHTIDRWLSGQAYMASSRNPFPPVLPHLCNRIAQEDTLFELFGDRLSDTKTPVIILHGHKWEEHYGFVDRLRYRRLLEELFGVRAEDIGVVVHNLQWNVDSAAEGKFDQVLITAIKRNVLESRMASTQEVQSFFQSIRQPQVLLLQVAGVDIQRCGLGLFEGFIAAWQNLFQTAKNEEPARRIEPPYPVALWINASYDDEAQPIDFEQLLSNSARLATGSLPVLSAVEEGHIQRWIGMEEVKRHIAGMEHLVLSLIEDDGRCFKKGKLHMRCFVEGVKEILE